jgi:uncharacterized protein YndB with AHSA1/START domain
MSQADELVIERETDLAVDANRLWTLISTAEGWDSWLVDEAAVVMAPDATGTAIEDGVVREVRINSIVEGRRVGFSWWDRDDPSRVSYVQLDIVELTHGRSHLHITERFVGSTTAATVAMSSSVAVSWEMRLISLWLSIVQSAVMA